MQKDFKELWQIYPHQNPSYFRALGMKKKFYKLSKNPQIRDLEWFQISKQIMKTEQCSLYSKAKICQPRNLYAVTNQ